jgi:hypothetical protein
MEFRPMSRQILVLALLAVSLPLAAQQPPKLEPLPEIPPPPPGVASEQPGDPTVRIQPGGGDQVEEQLIDGRRVVRVTTPLGQEYYLIEDLGDGPGLRNESLDRGVRVPLWVIRRF